MRCLGILISIILIATGAVAQGPSPASSVILIIDQDRLFTETNLGERALRELDDQARALAAENRRIEAELLAEERELTEQRPTLSPESFTELADAFDAKVQRLREEQDAKSRELARLREERRQAFFGEIGDVLSDITRERGAVVMLDRRQVFLALDSIDVTDEAIRRINAALGDGGDIASPQ